MFLLSGVKAYSTQAARQALNDARHVLCKRVLNYKTADLKNVQATRQLGTMHV